MTTHGARCGMRWQPEALLGAHTGLGESMSDSSVPMRCEPPVVEAYVLYLAFAGWLGIVVPIVGTLTCGIGFILGPISVFAFGPIQSRWLLSHTRYDEQRVTYDGSVPEAIGNAVVNGLLLIVTLGLALPWVAARNADFYFSHLKLDDGRRLSFDGTGSENALMLIGGLFLIVCTLGLAIPVVQIWQLQAMYSHVLIGGRRVRYTGNVAGLLGISFVYVAATLLTLGLALPWVIAHVSERNAKLVAWSDA